MKYIIKSNYEVEVEAKDKEEAIEKWNEKMTEKDDRDLASDLAESLYALTELEDANREDILNRYDNEEYYDPEITAYLTSELK